MKLSDIIKHLNLNPVSIPCFDSDIINGYTSDLLSDVMAHAKEGSALITIQSHINTIAVASLAGINTIILCNNRPVPDDMKSAAQRENIAITVTIENQFKTSYDLHRLLF